MQEDSTTPTPRRHKRALVWIAVGALAAMAMFGTVGSTVLAANPTFLHQAPPISSADAEECDDVGPGRTLWRFVLTQTAASSATLSVSFQNAGSFTSPSTKKTGGTLHFNVDIPAGDTLLGASVNADGRWLNLSGVCNGVTTTTTTTTTSTGTTTTGTGTTTTQTSSSGTTT